MNKELDRLDHLRKGIQYINQDESPAFISQYEEDLDIIETSLIDYEETDNQIYDLFEKFGINNRKDLLKQLKLLKIIKEKKVDAAILIESESLYDYNDYMNSSDIYNEYGNSRQLTQEEFDSVKEMLLQEKQ